MADFPTGPSDENDIDSLEGSSTVVEAAPNEPSAGDPVSPAPAPAPDGGSPGNRPPQRPRFNPHELFKRFNVYLALFLLLLVVGVVVIVIAISHDNGRNSNTDLASQSLSQSTLDQLANSDVTVGDPKQVLNVQSNAIFAGQVLVRSNLQVAGRIQVGGSLSLTGITVSGDSSFQQMQISQNLAVGGNENLQGQLVVNKSLSVNGSGTFKGPLSAPQLTVSSLQMNGDLNLNHHIAAGGPTPSRSTGSAVGNGGTASVSGSDTSGTVSISTGSGTSAGCFTTINFTQAFQSTPHVLITPVGSSAGSLPYYVNRSTANFSICTSSPAPSGVSFGFDYFVLD